jgi:DNA-binding winged helix-turn-helix (wHTH) protein
MTTVIKYKFEEFEADLRAAELRKNGNRLKLQMQPFQVLVALLERPKEVVTREELRQRLWPQDTFVDFDHGLNTAMVKLRDVLGDSASKPKFIETIAKRGYRFLGTAEVISDQPAPRERQESVQPEVGAATIGNPNLQPTSLPSETDSALPRASRNTARLLFTLTQIMYLIFYLSALFSWENTYKACFNTWGRAGATAFVVYLATSMVGIAVRLYLI